MKERRDLSRGGRRLRGASYRTAAAVGFALCLSTMLAAPPASAQSGWTLEMFGFDTWTDGWAPSSDPNCQGITNVCQTSDYVYELTGANQLRIDCDLRSEEGKREGRALVDLQTFCPYAIKVPVNLKDLHVGYEFEIPAMDPSVTNTKMQFFLTDVSNHTYYAAAIPFRTNAEHWWGGITVSTNPQSGGSVDAGFDPTRIRYAGIRVAMPTNSTGSYQGPLYTDYDYFYGHPDLFPDPANQKYAFISDAEGFVVQTYVGDRAATNLTWLSSGPSNRTGCLAVDLHLDATNSSYDAGEIYVDLLNDPPFGVAVPVDLKGKRVSAWVFCPAGLGSPPLYRFGVQVFCKDSNWNSFYGSWQTLEPYTTGAWFMVSMTPDTNTPSQGYMAPGFDPTQIRIVGLKVATSTGSGSKYDGKMYVDGFTFEAGPIQPVVSNLQYDFETDEDGFQPTDDPGNLAITSAVQNAETAAHASGSLKLGLNLDGNVPARDAGEVWVDMATYEPFGTPVPTDFAGREVAIYVYCPAGARGPSASPNGLQVFAKDDEWRSEYGTWTPVIEGSWQKVVLVPAATAPANGYMEAGFDPHAIRAIGLKFAANSTSSVYAGPIYMDAVCFAPPAADPFEPPANQRYSFDSTVAGWEAGSGDAGEAITNLFRTTGAPDNSTAALAAEVDLDATDPDKSKGEIVVFMDNDPPYGAVPPVDLEGETVTAWVYCPAGLRGDDETPNGFQLFVKDSSARSFYGEWQTVHEGYWYAVTAVPGTNAAPGGFKDPGFNAREVTAVGLKIGAADGSTAACRGLLFVDGVAFDAPLVPPGITNVQYDFEVDEDGFLPSDDAGNLAITAAVQVADFPAAHGDGTLKAWVNLDGSDGARDGGEVSVDASSFAPFRARYPLDLEGQEVSLYVYCPAGARGDNANPNALRVFVKDTDWRAEYGTWTPIVEGAWQKISLTPSTTEPPNGYMAEGFDPTRIRVVGVSLSAGATSAVYAGPIHVDAVGFETDLVPVQFDFEDGAQAFLPTDYSGDLAITAAVHTTAMSVEGAGALRLDIDLAGSDGARDGGEVAVDMQFFGPIGLDYPIDLENREILLYVYCPAGAGGGSTNLNGLRVLVKDGQWNAEYGPWTPVREGTWQCVSLTPSTNEPLYGYMAPGFDPTQIRMLGLSFSAGDTSSVYTGPLYLDAVCFDAELEMPADLRYGFEPNRQGWQHETYEGLQAVTAVAQSAAAAFEGAYALRMDLDVDSGTNEAKGATSVDMRWYPPPTVRAPFNLDGRKVAAYVYCPPGSGSGDPRNPNKLKLYVKDSDWKSQYGPCTAIREGEWVRVALTPGWTTPAGEGGYMQEGFAPTGIVQVGIEATLHGTYHGPLYLDHVSFPAEAPPAITNSQHTYDFEDECQSRFWKWSTNPQGWNALAWTNTYIAAGQGTANSAALAADAVFAGTNATWDYRKGVFEIAYNPPLNLATKDHRRIQAKVRMDPPVEGLIDFLASINVFDKNTDQWYWKDFNIGDSEWNILEFDLDDADDYSEWSPAGPMDASQIGYLVIQVVANMAWTGTIYVEDVVVGGVELPGSYDPPQGGIVTREGRNFMLDGTNFYFAGVNIEYINQALPLRTVVELLDLTTNLHLDIVRAWGFHEGQDFSFQPARGVWNEMAFENLDRVIAMSGDRNIRLMLGLADNWGHNGGMFKYMEWVLSEHPESLPEELRTTNALGSVALHDEFFVNAYAKQWYRDYVTVLLNRTNSVTGVRYKDDPVIFSWEIVNEPRCETDMEEGRPYGTSVHTWIHEMSDFVHSIDPNHMLAAGEEGGYITTFSNATERGYYQEFHRNYWLYGLRGEESSGAGAMADFVSDYRSDDHTVYWQLGTYSNQGEILSEIRPGCSNISLCPFRLYIDDKEYNIWHTNWNGYNQRREWVLEHTRDAHETINKPVVLEEFGIHAFGWSYQGFYGQYQHVPIPKYYQADRVDVYREIYSYVEDFDLDGSFFWNLGYTGMWEDPWYLCEAVGDWWPDSSGSDATGIGTDTNLFIQGQSSLKLSFDTGKGYGKAIYGLVTNEQWVVRLEGGEATGVNRVKFFWNVYNPGAPVNVAIALRVYDEWGDWHESAAQTITTGWNRVMFDLSAGTWKSAATGWEHTGYVREVLEDVRQVVFLVYGDNGAGEVYLDNITIRRDDGFIIYADDPVCDVIRDHADYMRAKSNGSTPPPACTISGTTYYSGMLTGLIHIVATGSGSADSDALAGPGAYTLTDVHGPDSFTVIAYRDCNGNGTQDAWEASGAYAGNPLYLTTDVTGIDIALIDPPGDSDSDNMTDVWEGLHFGDLTQAADGDSDRDGYMNYFEFMRGTLPAAPTSIPAATIYVDVSAAPGGDGSQGQPFNTIQPALNAAVHGDLVHLAAGVYTGSANRGLLFNNQRVMLYSTAGATSCVIDCQHLDRAILESNGMPGLALVPRVVRDVTICHGQPTNGLGGVIFVGSNGAMMFQKCILENNTASLGGVAYLPGPYVYQMRIDDSIIRGNSAGQGGVVYSYYAVPYLKGCLIQSNSASLAAVLYATETGTPPLLEDCTIERNQAGAAVVLYANAGAHPTARRCQIRENVATGSGGVMGAAAGAGAGPILESCMVVGNVSGTGGGVLGGSGIMRNCTMVNNVASNGLGGIARLNSIYMGPQDYATIVNCILWDFGANAFYGVVAPSVSYSDVQGGYAGTGNIDTNPLFQSGTYRLLPGSPCIDAGTASNAPATDWEGEARWDDPSCPNTYSIVDIGADEFVDRDDDDLLDAEEFVAQGLPAGSTNEEDLELLAQAGDADGDGAPDWYELRTGTSPTNSESIFAAGGGQTEASGEEAVVTWPSAAYKTYSLERSLDLASGFAAIATNIPATPPLNTYTDQPPTEVVYYRVQVE